MENKKPILNDAIKLFTDEEIIKMVLSLYPEQKSSEQGYRNALIELRALKPKRNKMLLSVSPFTDDLTKETYTDVCGVKPGDEMTYAIEYTPWEQWLGMQLHPVSLLHYNYLQIIAYSLWEMTWSGFSQAPIQKEFKELLKSTKTALKEIKKKEKKK
jgi:hypothetical protein